QGGPEGARIAINAAGSCWLRPTSLYGQQVTAARGRMDPQTLAAYDAAAHAFAADWHEQPPPIDLHGHVRDFFPPWALTADVGCGSGREVAWLAANGYPAVGFDPSPGLLAQARARYPGHAFQAAALPGLAGIPDNTYDNVLCETVIMHLG